MAAKAKKIELCLDNGTLDGMIYVSETDGWDLGGILYSCPRDSINKLLEDDSCNKYGVYLLLSSQKVYIGQSTDLKARIKQHQLGKDWWERVILLTSKTNELSQSHITYLEAKLISKAQECRTLDCDNRTEGNKNNLDKFTKKFLDQYLEEAEQYAYEEELRVKYVAATRAESALLISDKDGKGPWAELINDSTDYFFEDEGTLEIKTQELKEEHNNVHKFSGCRAEVYKRNSYGSL